MPQPDATAPLPAAQPAKILMERPAPTAAHERAVQLAAPMPAPLTADDERAVIPNSSVGQGELAPSSMIGVLHAALGTMLAAAWLMGGAWVGIRSVRISPPSMKPQTTLARARPLARNG